MPRILCLKHISCEGPGRLGDFAAARGVELQIVDLEGGEPVPPPLNADALCVLGGPMNVYEEDKHPYLAPETRLIAHAIKQDFPVLGLCLGGQLIAKAAGGRVTKNPVKEIGNFSIQLTQAGVEDPLFAGFPKEFPVFQWHGDTFSDIADGTLLALSPACAHQAFRIGRRAYGLQFHVEISLPMAREWFHEYNPEILEEKIDPNATFAEFEKRESDYAAASDRLFTNFFRIAGLG